MTFHTTDGLRPNASVIPIRRTIEDEIERLIALLDAIDADPDLELSGDEDEDSDPAGGDICDAPHDDDGDAEPLLGWEEECSQHGVGATDLDGIDSDSGDVAVGHFDGKGKKVARQLLARHRPVRNLCQFNAARAPLGSRFVDAALPARPTRLPYWTTRENDRFGGGL